MRLLVVLLAAGLVTFAPPAEDQTRTQPPVFRAGVDVVQLEVSVLDNERRPVRGLTAADFAVLEDGERQPVVDVQEVVLDDGATEPVWARAASTDVATNDLADRRLIAIVMDDLRCCYDPMPLPDGRRLSDPWAISNAIGTARHIVDALGPKDLATVALTREARPVQPFTREREALHATIARFAPMSEGGCLPRRSTNPGDLIRLLQLSPIPLKAVVHLTSVVPRGAGIRPPWCPLPSYRVPDTGQVVTGSPPRRNGPDINPLELARVPVYTLNVSGLIADPSRIARGQLPMSLAFMDGPNDTGGWNTYRANDLVPAVSRILDENHSYYLVGFRTTRPTLDGRYRRVEIKVTRSGTYHVRSREGYRRPKPAPAPGSREDRNPQVARPPAEVDGLLPRSDITLDTAAAAFPIAGKGAVLMVHVDLGHPIDTLMPKPQDLEVRAVVYRSGSAVRDVRTKAQVGPAAGGSRARTAVPLAIEIAPDRYDLWITARDPRTLRMGEVTLRIDVPDFATRTIAVSGIVLGTEPADGAPLHPAVSSLVPIVPTTARVFSRSAEITAYFQVYQGRTTPLGAASLGIRILDERGDAVLDRAETLGPDRFAIGRTAACRLRLPLQTLTPGRYLLTVDARVGDRIAPAQGVPFQVR